jgi:glutamate formiminotransferase
VDSNDQGHSCLQLAQAAVRIALEALGRLDLRSHTATHPRLGVADHISCHPLGDGAALEDAAALAKAIAVQLATGPHQLPVYLYGSASNSNRSLAEVRRQLGERAAWPDQVSDLHVMSGVLGTTNCSHIRVSTCNCSA